MKFSQIMTKNNFQCANEHQMIKSEFRRFVSSKSRAIQIIYRNVKIQIYHYSSLLSNNLLEETLMLHFNVEILSNSYSPLSRTTYSLRIVDRLCTWQFFNKILIPFRSLSSTSHFFFSIQVITVSEGHKNRSDRVFLLPVTGSYGSYCTKNRFFRVRVIEVSRFFHIENRYDRFFGVRVDEVGRFFHIENRSYWFDLVFVFCSSVYLRWIFNKNDVKVYRQGDRLIIPINHKIFKVTQLKSDAEFCFEKIFHR